MDMYKENQPPSQWTSYLIFTINFQIELQNNSFKKQILVYFPLIVK